MIRLLTYNIHGCIGRWRREDPDLVLEVIREADADVVALQEVYDDDAADIRFLRGLEELDYATVIHGYLLENDRGRYGNVLMSRTEPEAVTQVDLDTGGFEPRGAIRFQIARDGGRWDICATHLGLSPGERREQYARLERELALGERPPPGTCQVLLGDLNEWLPRSRFRRTLHRHFPLVSGAATFPARLPFIGLDRIALRGDHGAVRFRRLDQPPADRASDHRPLLAEVELEPDPDA